MPDLRETFDNPEENLRSLWAGIQKHLFTALPVSVSQDSDGKTVSLQPAIQNQVSDQNYDQTSYQDMPLLQDVPIKFAGGGGVTATHPIKSGDEGLTIFSSRSIDSWFQQGGTAQPIFNRYHSLADAMHIPGLRSMPRELKQISTDSHQVRSDDKLIVNETHPQNGSHVKVAAPSTAPASDGFDPFTSASKFFEHLAHAVMGIVANATNGGVTHSHGVNHDNGAFMRALNGMHQVLAHPTMGSLLSASGGLHTVTASPSGVMLASSMAISMSAPSLDLPLGAIAAAALADDAASDNVGSLGGDLAGTLPDPTVIGIMHVVGANMLPNAANDGAAASAGVVVGALYRNGSVLMVRVA